jgi:HAD superfamily hydrolase (TIGR01458 family)
VPLYPASQVFSSLRAARKVIQDQQLRPLLLLHPDALPEFSSINCSEPNAVVLGLAQEAFSYDSMNTAFKLLMQQPQAPLIAVHKGKYHKAADGQLALGPGPYAAALEFATGRTAQVCVQHSAV